MLFLAVNLLKAAGFEHNQIDDTRTAPVRPRLVATVECDDCDIREAMLEVHSVLEACECTNRNFAIRGRYVSLVGLSRAQVAAVE